MVLQKCSWFFSRVGEKQLFYFFERWNRALEKNECAVCAVGFFSTKFEVLYDFPHCAQRSRL